MNCIFLLYLEYLNFYCKYFYVALEQNPAVYSSHAYLISSLFLQIAWHLFIMNVFIPGCFVSNILILIYQCVWKQFNELLGQWIYTSKKTLFDYIAISWFDWYQL